MSARPFVSPHQAVRVLDKLYERAKQEWREASASLHLAGPAHPDRLRLGVTLVEIDEQIESLDMAIDALRRQRL